MFKKEKLIRMCVGACVCFGCVLLSGCGEKSGIEKLAGEWEMVEPDGYMFLGDEIEFYEPNEKEGSIGSLEYTYDDGTSRSGEYNYHESSEKIELAMFDQTGSLNDYARHFTFSVEFDGDTMTFTDEDSTYIYERMD